MGMFQFGVKFDDRVWHFFDAILFSYRKCAKPCFSDTGGNKNKGAVSSLMVPSFFQPAPPAQSLSLRFSRGHRAFSLLLGFFALPLYLSLLHSSLSFFHTCRQTHTWSEQYHVEPSAHMVLVSELTLLGLLLDTHLLTVS